MLLFRFTEELFATLIAFIFIFNAFKNVGEIGQDHKFAPVTNFGVGCQCEDPQTVVHSNMTKAECLASNGTLVF